MIKKKTIYKPIRKLIMTSNVIEGHFYVIFNLINLDIFFVLFIYFHQNFI